MLLNTLNWKEFALAQKFRNIYKLIELIVKEIIGRNGVAKFTLIELNCLWKCLLW